jgi:hypothetical protein
MSKLKMVFISAAIVFSLAVTVGSCLQWVSSVNATSPETNYQCGKCKQFFSCRCMFRVHKCPVK